MGSPVSVPARGDRAWSAAGEAAVREVADRCDRARELTSGLFDALPPGGGWDPSGLVKGWGAELAGRRLSSVADLDWCLNAGGATSGTGARGAHLYDPRTSDPVLTGSLSVSVSGPSLATADVLATAAFVAGDEWPAVLSAVPGYNGLGILADGTLRASPGWNADGSEGAR